MGSKALSARHRDRLVTWRAFPWRPGTWRQQGVLDNIRVALVAPIPTLCGVEGVHVELNRHRRIRRELRVSSETTKAVGAEQTVRIRPVAWAAAAEYSGDFELVPNDLLRAVPPEAAPGWLQATGLTRPGEPDGLVVTNLKPCCTVATPRFGLWGRWRGHENLKSGAALRKPAMVLAHSLLAVRRGREPRRKYCHYSATHFTV